MTPPSLAANVRSYPCRTVSMPRLATRVSPGAERHEVVTGLQPVRRPRRPPPPASQPTFVTAGYLIKDRLRDEPTYLFPMITQLIPRGRRPMTSRLAGVGRAA